MSLGNWRTVAFDKDANEGNGQFVLNAGFYSTIYKDWIYLHQGKAEDYFDNIFGEIHSGNIKVYNAEFNVHHDNEFMACFVFCQIYNEKEYSFYTGMGYLNQREYLFGLNSQLSKSFIKWLADKRENQNSKYLTQVIETLNRKYTNNYKDF